MMLHTEYQSSRPCGFRQEDVFIFLPILVYVKHVNLGAESFLAPGVKFEQLGRSLLDDTTYQISRLYALWFQTKQNSFALYISLCKICDPRAGPFLAPGL